MQATQGSKDLEVNILLLHVNLSTLSKSVGLSLKYSISLLLQTRGAKDEEEGMRRKMLLVIG